MFTDPRTFSEREIESGCAGPVCVCTYVGQTGMDWDLVSPSGSLRYPLGFPFLGPTVGAGDSERKVTPCLPLRSSQT